MRQIRDESSDEEIRRLLAEGKTPRQISMISYPVGYGHGVVSKRRRLEHRAFLLSAPTLKYVLRACKLPPDVDALLAARAKRDGVRPSDVMRDALERYLHR